MHYATLGTTDLRVSRVGFGGMSLGADAAADRRLLAQAQAGGITLFDTADLYEHGRNEELFGAAFGHCRAQVVLATKVGNQWRPDGQGWDWNPSAAYIRQAAEASLRRLRTDYIDLYQLHGGTLADPHEEVIEAFERLREQGKIRHYGISSIRPNVIRRYVPGTGLSSVMLQLSLLDQRPLETVLPRLATHGVGVLARGALAQGLLAGKPNREYLGHPAAAVQAAATAVAAVAARLQRPPAEVAGRFVLDTPGVTAAVLGIRTPAQLAEALQLARSAPLPPEARQELLRAAPANTYEAHR
ncbi:aldo/keto reductase [Hymenobacter actinosclerus]|uniref:Predicted oxidoreductase n=1 Tax=Hymenobacter actinosclerus TaxID=82805 RepID=A0A1I0EA20_9BACT|nr:aldo/keto reductase [Hymenobacter actinosclerus]SET41717.1 Predicted oxidoreductase [Hymenobacter actinosclerus]